MTEDRRIQFEIKAAKPNQVIDVAVKIYVASTASHRCLDSQTLRSVAKDSIVAARILVQELENEYGR